MVVVETRLHGFESGLICQRFRLKFPLGVEQCMTNRLTGRQHDQFLDDQADRLWYLLKVVVGPLLDDENRSFAFGAVSVVLPW